MIVVDTSIDSLVRAASGALFVAAGAFFMLRAREARDRWMLSVALAAFGVFFILSNLLPTQTPLTSVFSAIFVVALTWRQLTSRSPVRARSTFAFFALPLASLALVLADAASQGALGSVIRSLLTGAATYPVAMLLLGALAAWGLEFSAARDMKERESYYWLSLTFVPYVAYGFLQGSQLFLSPAQGGGWNYLSAVNAANDLLPIVLVVMIAFQWLLMRPTTRTAIVLAWAMLVSALAGAVVAAWFREANAFDRTGGIGIARGLGIVALAIGVFRKNAFGLDLHARAADRASLAAIALAALFVVAQVAQNFFAAQYGLLLGGVIAGCFLFAAQPVQRMIERRGERRVTLGGAGAREQTAFKAAVRAALAEGPITPRQVEHLSEVAESLGIGPKDMTRLKHEVENEGAEVRLKETES